MACLLGEAAVIEASMPPAWWRRRQVQQSSRCASQAMVSCNPPNFIGCVTPVRFGNCKTRSSPRYTTITSVKAAGSPRPTMTASFPCSRWREPLTFGCCFRLGSAGAAACAPHGVFGRRYRDQPRSRGECDRACRTARSCRPGPLRAARRRSTSELLGRRLRCDLLLRRARALPRAGSSVCGLVTPA